eukprot:CAMPEP_0172049480 /NCGR_PEP_ID=MMETSP1043-20130122/2102_1 /TAXON_ID=464988 /ORGANISM="Hemiselmis andersenii, Strain CCMP441" /LENGTH=40 /DNA_ID= /DNA_START= /DNA_END= /DNA_ORIENTATION=
MVPNVVSPSPSSGRDTSAGQPQTARTAAGSTPTEHPLNPP